MGFIDTVGGLIFLLTWNLKSAIVKQSVIEILWLF